MSMDDPFLPPEPEPTTEPASDPTPPPVHMPAPESFWMLGLGGTTFLLILVLVWANSLMHAGTQEPVMAKQSARLNTYQVEMMWSLTLYGDPQLRSMVSTSQLTDTAEQVAKLWTQVSEESHVPSEKGNALLNAAALYLVAGKQAPARDALSACKTTDPTLAGVVDNLQPLAADTPQTVAFTPQTTKVLDQLSCGPIYRATAARLAHDDKGAQAALLPATAAGMRAFVFTSLMLLLLGGGAVVAIIAYFVKGKAINAEVEAAEGIAPPVSWNIGTALLLIGLTYLLGLVIETGVVLALKKYLTHDLTLVIVSINAQALAALLVLGGYLTVTGRKPWEWVAFGWRRTSKGILYGLLGLVLILPAYLFAAFMSAALFGEAQQQLTFSIEQAQGLLTQGFLLVATAVMAPLIEETLFRGLLFRSLNARLPFWPAALITSVLFGAVHGELAVVLPIAVLSLQLCLLTRRSNSLVASATAHGIFNGVQTLFLFLLPWVLNGPGAQ